MSLLYFCELALKLFNVCVADISLPEPAPKASSIAATFATAGPYRRLATEIKDNDRLPSPEPEERINPYSLNRKRLNNPNGANRKPEKFKKAFREVSREEMSTDDDSPDEPPPVSFVTAKEKLVRPLYLLIWTVTIVPHFLKPRNLDYLWKRIKLQV
jgi:hypothetical protein